MFICISMIVKVRLYIKVSMICVKDFSSLNCFNAFGFTHCFLYMEFKVEQYLWLQAQTIL